MKTWQRVFALLALAVAGAACGGAPASPSPTAARFPTATLVPPTATVAPTRTPQPSPMPSSTPVALGEPYTHPAGLFTARPPLGWEVADEEDAWTSFTPSEGGEWTFFTVTALNTAVPLSEESLQRLVAGYLQTYAVEVEPVETKTGEHTVYVHQHWKTDEGVMDYRLLARQDGAAALLIELSVPIEEASQARAWWGALVPQVSGNRSLIEDEPPYNALRAFSCYDDFCSLDAPVGWYRTVTKHGTAVAYRLESPDGRAFIETVVDETGADLSPQAARKVAWRLVRQFDADDARELSNEAANGQFFGEAEADEEANGDGGDFAWASQRLGMEGKTHYDVCQGQTLVLLNFAATDDARTAYENIWDTALGSYEIPWWEQP